MLSSDWLEPRLAQVERLLTSRVEAVWPPRFAEALAHPLRTGGKMLRPALCLAAYQAVAGTAASWAAAVPAAAAVELVHRYSLVHDDLPAMDDDDTRRGQPTTHVRFGVAPAILVGDALLTEAFQVLAEAELPAAARLELVRLLARAAGHRGMVGGQAVDIGLEGQVRDPDLLLRLHRLKTGALITAASEMGGVAAEAEDAPRRALVRYGEAVGLAFQLADDLLDQAQDAADHGPPSFVKLVGPQATRDRAQALVAQAEEAARELTDPEPLVALARFAVARDH